MVDGRAPTTALRSVLEDLSRRYGLDRGALFELKVAATEALTNAIKGSPDGRQIDVAVEPHEDRIEVCVRNQGRLEIVTPALDEIESEGGRGIPLMFALVDEIELASGREGTFVRLRKRLPRRRDS
jgi:anti-sigma regulatory factor (Ser/Thr protein kinase)